MITLHDPEIIVPTHNDQTYGFVTDTATHRNRDSIYLAVVRGTGIQNRVYTLELDICNALDASVMAWAVSHSGEVAYMTDESDTLVEVYVMLPDLQNQNSSPTKYTLSLNVNVRPIVGYLLTEADSIDEADDIILTEDSEEILV